MAAEGSFVQAATSFSVQIGNVPVFITEGELWEAGDAVVKGRAHLFRDPVVKSTAAIRPSRSARRAGAVETATAVPGEQRQLSRPEQPPAKTVKGKTEQPAGEV